MDLQSSSSSWPEGARSRAIPVLAVIPACIALIPITIVGFCQWRAVREAEAAANLRRDLIDRGLTVAEVERLTNPAYHYREPESSPYYRAQHDVVEEGLKRDLAARGLSAEEIESIFRAWSSAVPVSGRYTRESADRARKDAELIKALVQNGRSAQEVERILRAAPRGTAETRRAEVESALRVLRHHGVTPEEVQRALRPQDAADPRAELPPRPE
jgi:hypothetical protein